ncbi:MAG: hypothetical protein ABIQ16_21105 [Polyangiaceae bacterium]
MEQQLRRWCVLGHLSWIILASSCSGSGASDVGQGAGSAGAAGAGSGSGGLGAPISAGAGSGGTSGTSDSAGSSGAVPTSAGNAGTAGQVASGECTPPTAVDAPLEKLSQTGCMSATEKTKFAARVVPYEVNSPLWSDSADKQRGMVIPVGKKVHIKNCALPSENCTQGTADTGKWIFPVGTVMLKNFLFDDKLVETRLFVRHDEQTWVGYSYRWDEAQTEATIVPPEDNVDVMFNTGKRAVPWQYPSRPNCMKCHNSQASSTLGPETRQMNRVVDGTNQIDKLVGVGLFDQPPLKPYPDGYATPYLSQAGSATAGASVEEKARSYMHANCAFCHRPDGEFPQIDLRYDTQLADMNVCNVVPLKGNQGVVDSVELKPGDPTKSILYLRMNSGVGNGRMPQIATSEIDTSGVKLIGDWITSASCPTP